MSITIERCGRTGGPAAAYIEDLGIQTYLLPTAGRRGLVGPGPAAGSGDEAEGQQEEQREEGHQREVEG
eukprot:1813006-Pyramimonas_sp.AAC.1